jgi:uncharacterized integral membrane protein
MAEGQRTERGKGRGTLLVVVWGVIGVLMLLFVLNNTQSTQFSIAFTTVTMPLWLLVLLVFGLGAVFGWITRWWTARR